MLGKIISKFGRSGIHHQSAVFSSLRENITAHNDHTAAVPLIEHHRPRWPQPALPKFPEVGEFSGAMMVPAVMPIPATRSVPSSVLRFEMNATFAHGSSIIYKHMAFNPADFKVAVRVYLADLQLTKDEEYILIRMVANRYNTGKREIRLTADKFPNRIENKRYLVYLLEVLIVEAKRLAIIQHQEPQNTVSSETSAENSEIVAENTERADGSILEVTSASKSN